MSYLTFIEQPPVPVNRKTKVWHVRSKINDVFLGLVYFKPQWRKYVFESSNAIFDSTCLVEITEFLRKETTEWRSPLERPAHLQSV